DIDPFAFYYFFSIKARAIMAPFQVPAEENPVPLKLTLTKAAVMAALFAVSAQDAGAADHRANPFTLAYDGAITANLPGRVSLRPVGYELDGVRIAANVYLPASYDPGKDY